MAYFTVTLICDNSTLFFAEPEYIDSRGDAMTIARILAGLSICGALLTTSVGPHRVVAASPTSYQCQVSKTVHEEPPKDPNASRFGTGPWYVNENRTIWAGWDAASLVVGFNKVLWIRPKGTNLNITGRRLDAQSAPLKASIPCCYPTGFQATGLNFPTAGCWEVTAKAGVDVLRFVTEVGPPRKRNNRSSAF